jgi:hypothetical protein
MAPSHAAPLYMAPTDVRNLFLANVSLLVQAGHDAQTQAALKSLRQDIDLWHRMLTGEGTVGPFEFRNSAATGCISMTALEVSSAAA